MPQPQPRKSRFRRVLFWLVVVALGAGAYYYFHGKNAGDTAGAGGKRGKPVPIVKTTPVSRQDVPVYLDGLGTVQAFNTVTVKSRVDGQLMEVAFREGQDVKKGDLLARIDPRVYQAQLDQAKATLAKDKAQRDNAALDLKRYENLGDTISRQTVDTQRATLRQLDATIAADQANIDNTATQLSFTRITSPIDGRTGLRQVDVGNIVHAGDTNGLVVVTQLEPITVMFSLPQQKLQPILVQLSGDHAQENKMVVLAIDNTGKEIDRGHLALIDNQIDSTTGTIRLKSVFPNHDRLLWPGGFTNVRLLLQTLPQQMVLPATGVQQGPDGSYVFVYKAEDHTVEMRPVKTTMMTDKIVVIESGLKEGEPVVTDGAGKLQDGAKVALPGEEAPPAAGKDDAKKPDEKAADGKPAEEKADDKGGKGRGHRKHDKE